MYKYMLPDMLTVEEINIILFYFIIIIIQKIYPDRTTKITMYYITKTYNTRIIIRE